MNELANLLEGRRWNTGRRNSKSETPSRDDRRPDGAWEEGRLGEGSGTTKDYTEVRRNTTTVSVSGSVVWVCRLDSKEKHTRRRRWVWVKGVRGHGGREGEQGEREERKKEHKD